MATDHEGGRVLRLRRGLTHFPDAAALGATGNEFLAYQTGKSMGYELRAIGINMNLAPVQEIGNSKSFLENRIWGEDGKRVGEMTTSYIRGLHSVGVLAVAKHFPGHSYSSEDSHFSLPQVNKTLSQLWLEDLQSFRIGIDRGLQAIMSAHVEVPMVDRGPASLSHRFLTDILRGQLGFKGLIITDDLEMEGAKGKSGLRAEDLAIKALKAGTDQIMVVWSTDVQTGIRNRILDAIHSGEIAEKEIDEKVGRILRLKTEFATDRQENPFWKENLNRPEATRLVETIIKDSQVWLAGDPKNVLKGFHGHWEERWLVVVPDSAAKMSWLEFRPQDEVVVGDRRIAAEKIKALKNRLEDSLLKSQPVLVVTGARASGSESLFKELQGVLGRVASKGSLGPVLWVHQGLRPVHFLKNPDQLKVGILSFPISSHSSWSVIRDTFKKQGMPSRDL